MWRKRDTQALQSLVGRYLQALEEESVGPSEKAVFAYNLLYLQPNGNFLLRGIWPKFEITEVAGQWTLADKKITLVGHGDTLMDVDADYSGQFFHRKLHLNESGGTPTLVAKEALASWSLLSFPGEYRFIGLENAGVPKGWGFPESTIEIETHIAQMPLQRKPVFVPPFLRREK